MRPVVLLDHLNVVRAEADVDDGSAGPSGFPLIALAFSLSVALVVRAHRGETNTQKQPDHSPHTVSLLLTGTPQQSIRRLSAELSFDSGIDSAAFALSPVVWILVRRYFGRPIAFSDHVGAAIDEASAEGFRNGNSDRTWEV